MYPPELRYYQEHEWVRTESGGIALVGITQFAQEQLGDVVFVDLPAVGTQLEQFGKFGEVESVKAVNDLFSPVSGEVVETNGRLKESPELVNEEPYGDGWMIRLRMQNPDEPNGLMDAASYQEMVEASQ